MTRRLCILTSFLVCISILAVSIGVVAPPGGPIYNRQTLSPGAQYSGMLTGSGDNGARLRGGDYAIMEPEISASWVATAGYSAVGGTAYWPGQQLPGSGDTITWVNAIAVIRNPSTRFLFFNLSYCHEIVNGLLYSAPWEGGQEFYMPSYYGNSTWLTYRSNLTTAETWTWSNIQTWGFGIKIDMGFGFGTGILQVDYVGIEYGWTHSYAPPPPPYEPPPGGEPAQAPLNLSLGIMSIVGMFGFVGLVVMPAFGIWIARNSDQDKLSLALKVMLGMVFCFALFYASLG